MTQGATMLVVLGFLMIAVFMFMIMTKRMIPATALIVVPVVFGLLAGGGLGLGEDIVESIENLAPTAALLFFAITYFGIMIDVGLFDPFIRLVVRFVKNDPAKLVLGTAVLTSVVSLDGDGSTTFIIVTSALLPIYLRLGVSPVVLTVVAAVSNGTLNIVPWGGPTARAASALNVSPTDIFVPMIPSMLAGIAVVFVLAYVLGLRERRRIGRLLAPGLGVAEEETHRPETVSVGAGHTSTDGSIPSGNRGTAPGARSAGALPDRNPGEPGLDDGIAAQALDPDRPSLRPRLIWFNLALTLATLTLLVLDLVPVSVIFMVSTAIALLVNFPRVSQQTEQFKAHASSVVSVVGMVLAAAVLTGVLNGSGMVDAMAQWLVTVIPDSFGPYMAVVAGLLSMPFTFLMSNDAYYFGILPVLNETASHYGISAVEMARASVVGQPVHMQSPLVPATLLLVALAKVDLGEHHRKGLWFAVVVSLVMLTVAVLTGVVPLMN